MTWFKIDDSFYDHPKVFDAPDCAVALWTRAGTWSARNLTDGFVPTGMPARFCDDPEQAVKELLNRGLWKRTKGGYQFHDWSHYQPTREEAIAGRDGMSSGGALGNHRRWHLGQGKKNSTCRYCIGSSGGDQPDGVNKPETQMLIGSGSGYSRNPHPEFPQYQTPNRANQGEHDRGTDRPPDRVGDAIPESGASPPARPVPALLGGRSSSSTHDRTREAPSPRCPQHLTDDKPPNCGACGDARKARTQWDIEQAQRARDAPRCPNHRGQPADNCALCRSERLAPT